MKMQQTTLGFAYNQKTNALSQQKNNKTSLPQNAINTPYVGAYYMPTINFRGEADNILVTQKDNTGNEILDKWGNPTFVLNHTIKEKIDEEIFEFDDPDGTKFTGTIKDALNKYILREDTVDYWGVYHGSNEESIANIKLNGPNPRKTSRTIFGPGIYFALSEGDAHDFCSTKIKADLEEYTRNDGTVGKLAIFNGAFYDKIATPTVKERIKEITHSQDQNILNDYIREVLVNDLKIDAGYGYSKGYYQCIVVFNPNIIKNIRNPNEY